MHRETGLGGGDGFHKTKKKKREKVVVNPSSCLSAISSSHETLDRSPHSNFLLALPKSQSHIQRVLSPSHPPFCQSLPPSSSHRRPSQLSSTCSKQCKTLSAYAACQTTMPAMLQGRRADGRMRVR